MATDGLTPLRRLALGLVCWVVGLATVPRAVCRADADDYFDGDVDTQHALARTVASAIEQQSERHFYHTGRARFDGQSAVAIYQMALLGLGQIALEHPEKRNEYLPAMRRAADRLADPRTLDYATHAWGRNGVVSMAPGQGHAYLGYINLGLGMLRAVDPETKHAALHDRLTHQLAQRLDASPTGLIETYPRETWPPDVAAVAGSIGLHARVTGTDRRQLLARWAVRFARCSIDEQSGYLVQRVKTGTCAPVDAPRGSGTAVGAYFISFADRALSARLHRALVDTGMRTLLGFGGLSEYAPGHDGSGDGNSGPVLLGVTVGATGFGIGSARAHGDRDAFRALYATAHLFGVPSSRDPGSAFATGGVLGNALLLAMLTAERPK